MARRRHTGFAPTDEGPRIHTCECGVRFLVALGPTGKPVFVEAQVDLAGKIVLCYEVDELERPVSGQLVMPAPEGYQGPRWNDHRLTCTKATYYQRRAALNGEL
jgi:hypothetical protein